MRRRRRWELVGILLVIALSTSLDHRTHLALPEAFPLTQRAAQVAQHQIPESRRTGMGPSISTFATWISYR